jgi:regulator of replication initiation timing
MDKLDLETAAKAVGGGGIIAIILNKIFGRRKDRYEILQTEISMQHKLIEEWKTTALYWIEESKQLRLEVVSLRNEVESLKQEISRMIGNE